MKFIDLFAGLGGFHLAASNAGGECVFACEIDEQLRSVYQKNFGILPEGDIRSIAPDDVPSHDLLCAGFPCQPFSKAGGQMGWQDDVRGTVFFNIVEILSIHKPEFVILENVAHFVRHDEGNTYLKVKKALESLGYDVDSKALSPHMYGIPQIRERMYLVGRLKGLDGFEWPLSTTQEQQLDIRDVLDDDPPEGRELSKQVIKCLETWQEFLALLPEDAKMPSFPIWSMEFNATYPYECDSLSDIPLSKLKLEHGSFGQSLDTWYRKNVLARVPSYARKLENTFPRWKQNFIRQNRSFYEEHREHLISWLHKIKQFPPSLQKFEWNCQGEERDIWKYIIQFRASGVRVKRPTTAPSLVAMTSTQIPIIGWERRYMTVSECARLQSMGELEHMPEGNAAFCALGNAVNVKVVTLILEALVKSKNKNKLLENRANRNIRLASV